MVVSSPDLGALAPEIVVTLGALVVLVLDFALPRKYLFLLPYVSLVFVALAGWSCLSLWGRQEHHMYNMLALDNLRLIMNLIVLAGTALALLMSPPYLKREETEYGEYYALVLFAALGMMVMAAGLNLVVIFVGLETFSISVYILSAFARGRQPSYEAGMKYLLIGSFATAFLLYGMVLIYAATGSLFLTDIKRFLMTRPVLGDKLLTAGLALMIVGFGFKVAAFPFHVWTPDVYEGAPTPVTAFMAAAVKTAAFAAFARVFMTALSPIQPLWEPILWWLSVLTMTFGNFVAIAQTNVKRMLAYSSIAHAGYALIALVAGTPEALTALSFYMLAYTLMTAGAFGAVVLLSGKGDTNSSIYDICGLGFRFPWLGAAVTVFMVSLAGIPPTAGFFAKFYLFSAAVNRGLVSLAVVAVINSVVSVYYYFRVVVMMYMHRREQEAPSVPLRTYAPAAVSVGIAAVAVLVIGILPSEVLELAKTSVVLALTPR